MKQKKDFYLTLFSAIFGTIITLYGLTKYNLDFMSAIVVLSVSVLSLIFNIYDYKNNISGTKLMFITKDDGTKVYTEKPKKISKRNRKIYEYLIYSLIPIIVLIILK